MPASLGRVLALRASLRAFAVLRRTLLVMISATLVACGGSCGGGSVILRSDALWVDDPDLPRGCE
jgi:hypothetical protein